MFLRFIFKKNIKNFSPFFERFGSELAHIGMGNYEKNKNRRRTITAVLRHNNNTTNL